MKQIVDISKYRRDHRFYGDLSLLVSIKSFDLQEVRSRYLQSRKEGKKRVGSNNRREKTMGGIAQFVLSNGQIRKLSILNRLIEPRAVDCNQDRIVVGTDRKIWVFEKDETHLVRHPWFSYIHTAMFSPFEKDKILVASSGYDMILELNYKTGVCTYEWLAWENGFDQSYDTKTEHFSTLTRNEDRYKELKERGQPVIYIADPINDSLPTAKRTAFINTVAYHPENPDIIYATFFHRGSMMEINRKTGSSRVILEGMKSPHGARLQQGEFFATSTASGEVISKNSQDLKTYLFAHLADKALGMEGLEWIQNSIKIDSIFLSIDSNRNSFVLFQPEKKLIDLIHFDPNWAIQDMVLLKTDRLKALERISKFNFDH